MHNIIHFFDKLEDRIRGHLSRKPIVYAWIGGIGMVSFWRGTWHTIDDLMLYFFTAPSLEYQRMDPTGLPWWDGPLSLVVGTVLLLLTGVFVSNFIGNEIIISGLKREKKITEKTEQEIQAEASTIDEIHHEVHAMAREIHTLEKDIHR